MITSDHMQHNGALQFNLWGSLPLEQVNDTALLEHVFKDTISSEQPKWLDQIKLAWKRRNVPGRIVQVQKQLPPLQLTFMWILGFGDVYLNDNALCYAGLVRYLGDSNKVPEKAYFDEVWGQIREAELHA